MAPEQKTWGPATEIGLLAAQLRGVTKKLHRRYHPMDRQHDVVELSGPDYDTICSTLEMIARLADAVDE